MDFDRAAQRLKKDQSKLKGRRSVEISAKAKREAELRKKQQDRLAAEKKKQQRREEYIQQYMQQCEAKLGVKCLSNTGSAQFKATSIYGEGDKIALPPSVLQFLTESGYESTPGSPWTFRIGILNPNYSFPSSPLMKTLTVPDEGDAMEDSDDDSSDEEDNTTEGPFQAYVDELAHKYLAYTHGTVVEFTQEEGYVGLPEPIASSLIRQGNQQRSSSKIPTTRPVDPASKSNDDTPIEVEDDEKTPGHLAWGAFDVPDLPIEVSLVQLPKGRSCTLLPTTEAIENGFYNLKDIKLVLEQSLIRTRATLSINDMVHTWHRGTKYTLQVTALAPSTVSAVICINTDIEVEFAKADRAELAEHGIYPVSRQQDSLGHVLSGRRLNDTSRTERQPAMPKSVELLPEPPEDQSEGVCIIQIRADTSHGRRRFEVRQATIKDLFDFAALIASGEGAFRLVARFPRRVFTLDQASSTLADAGIQPGQEMFMLERL